MSSSLPDGAIAFDVSKLPNRFLVRGLLMHDFATPTGTDRSTGREYGGDLVVQLASIDQLRNGEKKIEMTSVSVSPEQAGKLREKVGQVVELPVLVRATPRGLGIYSCN